MSGLFGPKQPTAVQPVAAQGINVQTSVFGKAVPIVYGMTRIAGNLIMYGNFQSVAIPTTAQAGGGGAGKGGLFNSATTTTQTTYNYFASFAFALCEGPIINVRGAWLDKDQVVISSLDFSLFTGTYPQAAWGTTITWTYTDKSGNVKTGGIAGPNGSSLNYNGICYVAAPRYSLGTSTVTPNHSFEVEAIFSNSVPGRRDADPFLLLQDFLTNTHYGLGFPSDLLNLSANQFQEYTVANALMVSPAYTTQQAASAAIDELMAATNCAVVWSSGLLTVVPYGDVDATQFGATYVAPTEPLFSLDDDDFIAKPQGSAGDGAGPIVVVRKRPSDRINSIKIEYLNRDDSYNPAVAIANDQAAIDTFGLRTNGSKQMHLFCDSVAATLSANLQLRREAICNMYYFDTDVRYIVLDPMDIIAISDDALGLDEQWVRIVQITENDDGTLSFVAEEYLQGTGNSPAYSFEESSGFNQNRATPPGDMTNPVFFEPTWALSQALEVWCAPSAPASSLWGGADIYISNDDINYQLFGRVFSPCRVGLLTATLPSVTRTIVAGVPTIDQDSTLSVDLTESSGVLSSGTTQQANELTSLCWVDGEFLAYANATLTATNKYNLTYLARGAYDTPISSHAIDSTFVRCDGGIFKLPYTTDRIGTTIFVKFLSFNIYWGGQTTLADASAYTYTIQGLALTGELDDVTNVTQAYIGNITVIDWSEITDFRPILYEIRKGESWDGGQFIVQQAHPPFKTFGSGTYWVAAFSQPIPNLILYSPNPVGIDVDESNVTENIIASHEEDPLWTGSLSGDVVKVGDTIQTNGINGGTYTIDPGHQIFCTAPFACAVIIDWTASVSPLNNSVFTYQGGAVVSSGSATVSGLRIFQGTGRLHGNATVDNLLTTFGMGPGQPITGIGVSSGAKVLAVTSTTSLTMTIAATTGSTVAGSTQTITVDPALAIGQVFQSTWFSTGVLISAVPTFESVTLSTTALHTSTGTVQISIDWLNLNDFFGAGLAQYAEIHPEIRVSTDGGSNWSDWQRYVSGYYLGNGFDARMSMIATEVESIGILEAFKFSVDVPDRWDHYNSFAVSSLGSTITFRPDGMTTAAFNGGPQGSTVSLPSLVGNVINSSAGFNVAFSSISLSGCIVSVRNSAGTAQPGSVNVIAKGY